MKSLQWAGLVFSLLIIGVLGGLMAPLSSEAAFTPPPQPAQAPSLKIDGVSVTDLVYFGPGCKTSTGEDNDPAFLYCWSIPGTNPAPPTRQIGNWYVGDVSTTNGARVLVDDVSTAGSYDQLLLTGVTFAPVVLSGTKTTHIYLSYTFNTAGGNTVGNYGISTSAVGYLIPSGSDTSVNDYITLNVRGYNAAGTQIGNTVTVDKGKITSPTGPGSKGNLSLSVSQQLLIPSCNTGSSKCTPKVEVDYYIIALIGADKLTIENSVGSVGVLCDPVQQTNQLPFCGNVFPGLDGINDPRVAADQASAYAAGAEEAETCLNTCIMILITGTPDKEASGLELTFTATGQGVKGFTRKLNSFGLAAKAFSPLDPDTDADPNDPDDRVFAIPVYPPSKRGIWQTDQIGCVSELNDGTATWTVDGSANKGPLRVHTIAANDILRCTWHVHREINK